jgi:hypothetical protein
MKQIGIFVLIIFNLGLVSCTDTLNVKEKELFEIEVPNKPYKLRVVHMPSNATIQSSIQVRELYGNNEEKVLQDYERYNYLESYKLLSDTALMIVIKDTISYLGSKHFDTMIVKLK